MTTLNLNDVTRIVIRKCPVPPDLHEVRVERDTGRGNDERSITQMFLTLEEIKNLKNAFDAYIDKDCVQ